MKLPETKKPKWVRPGLSLSKLPKEVKVKMGWGSET